MCGLDLITCVPGTGGGVSTALRLLLHSDLGSHRRPLTSPELLWKITVIKKLRSCWATLPAVRSTCGPWAAGRTCLVENHFLESQSCISFAEPIGPTWTVLCQTAGREGGHVPQVLDLKPGNGWEYTMKNQPPFPYFMSFSWRQLSYYQKHAFKAQ